METIKASKVISNADGTTVSTAPDTTITLIYKQPHFWLIIIIALAIGFMIGRKMAKK